MADTPPIADRVPQPATGQILAKKIDALAEQLNAIQNTLKQMRIEQQSVYRALPPRPVQERERN